MSLPDPFGRYQFLDGDRRGWRAADIELRQRRDPLSGARVHEGRMPPLPTPYDGPMVVGDHQSQFIWGDRFAQITVNFERNGRQIVGRARPPQR